MYMGDNAGPHTIAPGQTAVAFLGVSLPEGRPVPDTLANRLVLGNASITGAEIGTHHTPLLELGPPV